MVKQATKPIVLHNPRPMHGSAFRQDEALPRLGKQKLIILSTEPTRHYQ